MTKVFTALLLVDMVRTRAMVLTDPVAKYLPKGTKLPERNGRAITLVDLATHTSGLPFMPDNLPGLLDPAAASYSQADLYRFVAAQTLSDDIGTKWSYSNLDYWLLQEAHRRARPRRLSRQLLQRRVIAPLGLQQHGDHIVRRSCTYVPQLVTTPRCSPRRRLRQCPFSISCRRRAGWLPLPTIC